ncbi:saccharopine dehydrogenase NADP-binding domain-containing protein, partial [Streptomyces sp. SID8380]
MEPNTLPGRPHETARNDREFDLVLYGASGFIGALTAAYLAEHAPPSLRWALAGRGEEKLERTRAALGLESVPVLTADAEDATALRALAARTRVVATTVGPYLRYGDALVGACADAGTDYADLAGEPEFIDRSYLRHEARAQATGARLVHGCGFDSVPADL